MHVDHDGVSRSARWGRGWSRWGELLAALACSGLAASCGEPSPSEGDDEALGAAAEALATFVAYDNGVIMSPWADTSSGSTRAWANTARLHDGKKTVKVVYSAQGTLALSNNGAPLPAGVYDSLDFYANGATAKPALNARVYLADSGTWSAPKRIASYCDGGFVPKNAWTHCTVPFSALGARGHSIGGLQIVEAAGKAVTVYFSTIGFGPPVSVSVSPQSPSVDVGATQQLSATVTGATNTAVTWSVSEASGCGSVSGTGLYTAPPTARTCHVVATSVADTTKSATATVTVTTATASTWNPKWEQRPESGSWWAVFSVLGGSMVRSVTLEVVGGASYPLEYAWGVWQGGVNGTDAGTTVILRATEVTGATAETLPFRYLVDTVAQTNPAAGTPSTNPSCTPPTRGMVTISFDDSLESQYLLARPVMAKYGVKATIYQITGQITPNGGGGYLNIPEAQALAAEGHEVGSHTVTHPWLTSLSVAELDYEFSQSQSWLQTNIGGPVQNLASPMGAYNDTVLTEAKKYYQSHRTVNPGSNYLGQDLYQLNADGFSNTTTVAEACAWIQDAARYAGWRIFYWHDFINAPTSSAALVYPIASFDEILACAKNTPNIDVVTTAEGVARYACAAP